MRIPNPLPAMAFVLLSLTAMAGASAQPFVLAPLPYSADALAPVIDETTVRIHHGRHHQAYVDGLNRAVAQDAALGALSLEQLLAQVSRWPVAVRNNGGGHWNHAFFWASTHISVKWLMVMRPLVISRSRLLCSTAPSSA